MYDAVLVLVGSIANDELVGMDDDGIEVGVSIEAELENRQARHRRNAHALRLVERHTARRFEALLVQEQQCQYTQAAALIGGQTRESRDGRDRGRPQLFGYRVALENAPPAPALEQP
jgi:hypothetical protein